MFSWSVGSLLFLLSWAVLMGPLTYIRHLISGPRLPFTAAYFGSIAMTLYFAIGVSLAIFIVTYIKIYGYANDNDILVALDLPYVGLVAFSNCRTAVVFGQLFSHG